MSRGLHCETYLIVKLAAAGDVLLTTALARAVRRARPQAHLAWLVSDYAAPLLAHNPDLDQVLVWPTAAGGPTAAWVGWRRLRDWAGQHPDARVLLAHRSRRLRALLRSAGLRHVTAWEVAAFDPSRHRLQWQADLLAAAGIPYLPAAGESGFARPQLHLQPQELAVGERLWADRCHPRWVFAPGGAQNPWASMPNRRWPLERFRALAQIARNSGVSILWMGARTDLESIAALPPRAPDRVCAGSGRSLRVSAAAIAAADLVIGNDSLPLVLAHALGRHGLGLYGPTAGAAVHAPGEPFLQGLAGCGPCYDPRDGVRGQAYRCPQARCMANVAVADVWAAACRGNLQAPRAERASVRPQAAGGLGPRKTPPASEARHQRPTRAASTKGGEPPPCRRLKPASVPTASQAQILEEATPCCPSSDK